MKEDRPLTREEIEDILDRVHINEYEWYIDDKEDDHLCSSSEEDAELVEKAIKGLINQYQTDYISKDKIREKIKEYREQRIKLADGHFFDNPDNTTNDFAFYVGQEVLKKLLEE